MEMDARISSPPVDRHYFNDHEENLAQDTAANKEHEEDSVHSEQRYSRRNLSKGEIKLDAIIRDIDDTNIEDELSEKESPATALTFFQHVQKSRRFLVNILEKLAFHYTIISLVIFDMIVVFTDLILIQVSSPCLTEEEMHLYNTTVQRPHCVLWPTHQSENAENALYYISLIILCIFVLEICVSFFAFGWRRYLKPLFLIDACIVMISFCLEVYFHFGMPNKAGRSAAAITILRLWKIVRVIHAVVHAMSFRNQIIVKNIRETLAVMKEEKNEVHQILEKERAKIMYLLVLLKEQTSNVITYEQLHTYMTEHPLKEIS